MWCLTLAPPYSCRLRAAAAYIFSPLDVACFFLMTHDASQGEICLRLTPELILQDTQRRSELQGPWRRFISTQAVLVQLLKAIPIAGTESRWHLPHQFARSGSFPWSRCNHDRRQPSREAQRDWSSEFLCRYGPDDVGLRWGQRRCVCIYCHVSFKVERFASATPFYSRASTANLQPKHVREFQDGWWADGCVSIIRHQTTLPSQEQLHHSNYFQVGGGG